MVQGTHEQSTGESGWGEICAPIAIFFASISVHIAPFFFFGAHPLGYDTGFYRRYLIEPFVSFPNPAVPGLGDDALLPRMFFDFLRFLHIPTDGILYGSYILLFALLPVLIYFFIKPTLGMRGALLAAVFVIFSPVQYAAYWYFLWKNAWAILLLFGAFIGIERNFFLGVVVLDIAIAFSHKTSAVVYIATLIMLAIISREKRRSALTHIVIAGAALLAINLAGVNHALRAVPSAVFLEWQEYMWLSLAFFGALAVGWKGLEKHVPHPLIAFAIASFAFPIFHLPIYERVFVFTDVALALFAAFAVEWMLATAPRASHLARGAYFLGFALLTGTFFGTLVQEARALPPLIDAISIQDIQNIGRLVPKDATLLTTANEAPWYEGWTTAHIAAPGMLRDNHNLEVWTAFWGATSTKAQKRFLDDFPKPLYISTLGDFTELIGIPPKCFKPVSPWLLLDTCQTH